MKGEILKNTVITAITGVLASVFNLGFLIFLGKALSPAEFGDFGVVLSLNIALSVVVMVYNAIVVRYLAFFAAKSQDEKIITFARRALISLSLFGLASALAMVYFAREVQAMLSIESVSTLYLLALFVAAECISQGFAGVLTGMQRFGALGFARIMQSAVVLAVASLLVLAGFSVDGALLGLISGALVLVPFSVVVLHRRFFIGGMGLGKVGAWRYMALAIPVSLALGVLISSDVLLAKYYLTPEQAGDYAAAAAIGTFGFFIAASIIRVMFPKVASFHSNGRDALPILREGLVYLLSVAGLLTVAIVALPQLIARLLLGAQFNVAGLVQLYSPAMLFLSLLSVFIMYLLAVRRSSMLVPVVIAAAVKVLIVRQFHQDAQTMVVAVFLTHLGILLVFILMYKDTLLAALRKRREYFDYTDLLQYPEIKNS